MINKFILRSFNRWICLISKRALLHHAGVNGSVGRPCTCDLMNPTRSFLYETDQLLLYQHHHIRSRKTLLQEINSQETPIHLRFQHNLYLNYTSHALTTTRRGHEEEKRITHPSRTTYLTKKKKKLPTLLHSRARRNSWQSFLVSLPAQHTHTHTHIRYPSPLGAGAHTMLTRVRDINCTHDGCRSARAFPPSLYFPRA